MSDVSQYSRTFHPPSDEYQSGREVPRWSRQRSRSLSSSRRSTPKGRFGMARARARARRFQRWALKRVNSMTLGQKIVGSIILLISATLGILALVFHGQILHAMLPISEKLRSWKAGWLFIFVLCFAAAFPPMIGYSTSVTLAGFVYGFPNGWFIVAAGTIIGATTAFMACRHFFRNFAKRMVATDKRFAAVSLTLKHDGVKLLCMIRLCPLPYSISNGAMSTFPTVSPWAFMLATAFATPKLLIPVWIGDRLANLAKDDQKMDVKTKIVNWCSIIGGLLLGAILGWVVYTRTMARARQLEAEEHSRMHSQHSSQPSFDEFADEDAVVTANIISGLIEGDELEASGMFTDLDDDNETNELDILLGDESEDDEGIIGMVERESMDLDNPLPSPNTLSRI